MTDSDFIKRLETLGVKPSVAVVYDGDVMDFIILPGNTVYGGDELYSISAVRQIVEKLEDAEARLKEAEAVDPFIVKERDLLRQAVVRYCDHRRMGTVEPPELQQVIDDAFAARDFLKGRET